MVWQRAWVFSIDAIRASEGDFIETNSNYRLNVRKSYGSLACLDERQRGACMVY